MIQTKTDTKIKNFEQKGEKIRNLTEDPGAPYLISMDPTEVPD